MTRIGLIARMDDTGLGNQTKAFYDHLKPARTMVINLFPLNGNAQHPDWYDKGTRSILYTQGLPTRGQIDYFLQDIDVVLTAETFYNDYLIERARELGIKTAVQYNYEFFTWMVQPNQPQPDLFIAPSMWRFADVATFCENDSSRLIYLHCPVDRSQIPLRDIKQARTFLHTAGRPAANDRNGTEIVIEASKYIQTDAKILIHFQGEQGLAHQLTHTIADYERLIDTKGDKSRIIIGEQQVPNYADVYKQGDVLVLPRRYGGNCLPLNEALSAGMPVIMPDVSPNNYLLPDEWLVPAQTNRSFTPRVQVDIYDTSPRSLAKKIDEFYGMSEIEFKEQHEYANQIADDISWDTMKPAYIDALEDLCKK